MTPYPAGSWSLSILGETVAENGIKIQDSEILHLSSVQNGEEQNALLKCSLHPVPSAPSTAPLSPL